MGKLIIYLMPMFAGVSERRLEKNISCYAAAAICSQPKTGDIHRQKNICMCSRASTNDKPK